MRAQSQILYCGHSTQYSHLVYMSCVRLMHNYYPITTQKCRRRQCFRLSRCFLRSSGEILWPQYRINGLNNFNKTWQSTFLYWWSDYILEVKGQGHTLTQVSGGVASTSMLGCQNASCSFALTSSAILQVSIVLLSYWMHSDGLLVKIVNDRKWN